MQKWPAHGTLKLGLGENKNFAIRRFIVFKTTSWADGFTAKKIIQNTHYSSRNKQKLGGWLAPNQTAAFWLISFWFQRVVWRSDGKSDPLTHWVNKWLVLSSSNLFKYLEFRVYPSHMRSWNSNYYFDTYPKTERNFHDSQSVQIPIKHDFVQTCNTYLETLKMKMTF